jgi:hypothetical protein
MAYEYLAGKVGAQAAMLQAASYNATLKQGTLAPTRLTQLIATTTARAILVGRACATIAPTGSGQPTLQTLTTGHAFPLPFPRTVPYYNRFGLGHQTCIGARSTLFALPYS